MMLLTSYCAPRIHPFMAIRVFNPLVPIVCGIQDNVTVCRLFSHTLQPLFLLLVIRAVKLLFASRSVFVFEKLGTQQAMALMRGAQSAELRLRLVCLGLGCLL